MKSPAYWSPALYDFFVRIVWNRNKAIQQATWNEVSAWIPDRSSVLELAAGTGRFYRECLRYKNVTYRAVDINPAFVAKLVQCGIDAFVADIAGMELPPADHIVMLQALYHFKDRADRILHKMLNAARESIIIVEPVDKPLNRHYWRDILRAKLVDTGSGPIFNRFQSEELIALCKNAGTVTHIQKLPDNQLLIVLKPG